MTGQTMGKATHRPTGGDVGGLQEGAVRAQWWKPRRAPGMPRRPDTERGLRPSRLGRSLRQGGRGPRGSRCRRNICYEQGVTAGRSGPMLPFAAGGWGGRPPSAAGPVADADSAPCAAGDTTAPGVRVRQGWGVGARTRGGGGEGSALGAEVRGEGVGTEGKQRGLSESRPQRPSVWMPTSGGPATAGQRPRAH